MNTLHHGDALKFLATLQPASFDALITDPPYASGGTSARERSSSPTRKYQQTGQVMQWADFPGDERDQRGHLQWMVLWLSEAFRVLKDGAPLLVFTDWRQLPLTTDALQCAGFTWRGIVPWDKTEAVRPMLGRFRNQAEFVVWGSKGAMSRDRPVPVLPGAYRVPIRRDDKHHLTGKPTDLMRALVRIAEPGGVILDPFAGSGTTLVAAQLEGYAWTGCEMTRHYFDVATARLASSTADGTA